MALVKCPECGRENVSDTAESCPGCGFNVKGYFDHIKEEQAQQKKDEEAKRQAQELAEEDRARKEELKKDTEQLSSALRKIPKIAGIVIIIVVVCRLGFLFYQNYQEKKYESANSATSQEDVGYVNNDYNNVPDTVTVTDDNELGEVWAMTQEFVTDELKSPSTADFPVYGADGISITKAGNTYTVIGYVDSENGFGADLRTNFILTMTKSGDKYTKDDLTFLDN